MIGKKTKDSQKLNLINKMRVRNLIDLLKNLSPDVNVTFKLGYDDEYRQKCAKAEKREPELIPSFSAHSLRHTFCTRFCENETNIKVIQEVMGHKDVQTTLDIYAESTTEKKQEVINSLQGKIIIK